MSDIAFPVKTIRWSQYEQATPILLQEENGPCPLIALVNTLLLKSDIEARTLGLNEEMTEGTSGPRTSATIDSSKLRMLLKRKVGDRVLLTDILATLGDLLFDVAAVDSSVVNNILESLPLLHTGLDVNPDLTSGGFPNDDLASQIFHVFGLNYFHGWCWQPNPEVPADQVFTEFRTFDSIQDSLLGTVPGVDDQVKQDVRLWLEENSTQLTAYGLEKLDQGMSPDLVVIFFRNNHFSTLYKANNHDFYLLITDTAFLKSNKYVWQSLISASGSEDLFFTGDFLPIVDSDDYNVDANEDDDMALVRQLQEKEDSEYAERLQRKLNSKKSSKIQGKTVSESVEPKVQADPVKDKKKKKKGNCVIV